jgi:hypothetical protein
VVAVSTSLTTVVKKRYERRKKKIKKLGVGSEKRNDKEIVGK